MAKINLTLPTPPSNIEPEVQRYLLQLASRLGSILSQMNYSVAEGWVPTNVPTTGNKAIDADSATLQQTSRSLARLIQDLKDGGLISGSG